METTEHSALLSRAIDNAFSHGFSGAPFNVEASIWANYLVLALPMISFTTLESYRLERGYTGQGSVKRFEAELLEPFVRLLERSKYDEQTAIDAAVERTLQA